MDPYPHVFPHQRDSNSYQSHYHPSWEGMSPQVKPDSFKYPSFFGPVPFNGNMSHPNPSDHNTFCNYSYPPGYYNFRPPCSHVQPPPHLYYYGPYPPYPDAYPGYFIPPPHYTVDQARYDYDKARNHCCGCPNHACHQKNENTLKIEEQKPDKEQSSNSSLIQLPNYPNQVMWVPPNYMKDKDTDKIADSQPDRWNGWIPVDINSLKNLRQGAEEKKSQQREDTKTLFPQFPFPVIWMPDSGKPDEAIKDLNEVPSSPKPAEERTPNFKIIPLKLLEHENRGEKQGIMEGETRNQVHPEAMAEKESRTKTIPVRQLEEREKPEDKTEEKSILEKRKEDSGVKKAAGGKESSPAKSTKLPPVCLRVDPLPRRKKTNGTSRSPSPPGLKEEKITHVENKEHGHTKETREQMPKEIPVIYMKDKEINQEEEKGQKCRNAVPDAPSKNTSEKVVAVEADKIEDQQKAKDGESKVAMLERKEIGSDEEGKFSEVEHEVEETLGNGTSENKKIEKRKERITELSQSDAAVIIQSAFRGYEVRRWQPLEKLRKIAQIHEQVGDVRRQILALEACPREQDAKQRMVISETIMNLLLQLDTIQGLHPSTREVRKCVARELICLQEKLDTLCSKVTQEHKPAEVEENLIDKATDDEASCIISLCPTTEQESVQQKLDSDSVGSMPTKEPEDIEENDAERSTGDEVAFLVSPSLVTDQHAEQETLQSADENGVVKQPSVQEVDSDQKEEDRAQEGEKQEHMQQESDAPLPLPKDEIASTGNEEHEVTSLKENEYDSKAVVPMDSELVSEAPCNPEVSADREFLQFSASDGVPELNLKEFPEPQDVSCQQLESVKGEVADFGCGKDAEDNQDFKKPFLPSVEEESNIEESAVVKIEQKYGPDKEESAVVKIEQKYAPDEGEYVVIPTVDEMPDDKNMIPEVQNEEAGNEQEKPQSTSLVEEVCEQMEKPAGVSDDNSRGSEAPSCGPACGEEENSVGRIMEENLEMPASLDDTFVVCDPIPVDTDQVLGGVSQHVERNETDLEYNAAGEAIEGSDSKERFGTVVHESASVPEPILENTTNGSHSFASKDEGRSHSQLEASASLSCFAPMMDTSTEEKKLVEENAKLREMLEKLLEAGKEQLGAISSLNGRVKDLERRLAQKKRAKAMRLRPTRLSSCKVSS